MHPTTTWREFSTIVDGATCAIIAIDALDEAFVQRLDALRARNLHTPLVLVMRKDADHARLVRRVRIQEIIWANEMEARLPEAIARMRHADALSGIAIRLETALQLPPRLRDALVFLFRVPKVITSVEDLAILVGSNRSSLWRWFVTALPPKCGLRLQDIIDWNLLLRAAEARAQTTSWATVAVQLSVHEHTLARTAKRLAGLTLREVVEMGPAQLHVMFERRVLAVLLDEKPAAAISSAGLLNDREWPVRAYLMAIS